MASMTCDVYASHFTCHVLARQVCKDVFQHQLRNVVDIRGVYDFTNFLRHCRPRSADRNVRMQYAFTFETRDGTIFVRSKQHCGAGTPWGPWAQMYPFPGTNVVRGPEECPPMQEPKPWPELKDVIAPSLIKFYERRFPHPVTIPRSDFDSMRSLGFTHDVACPPFCFFTNYPDLYFNFS